MSYWMCEVLHYLAPGFLSCLNAPLLCVLCSSQNISLNDFLNWFLTSRPWTMLFPLSEALLPIPAFLWI